MALAVGEQQGWLVAEGGEPVDKWSAELSDILGNLDDIRLTAEGADPGGLGIVATPSTGGAFSGFEGSGDPPTYPNLRHVASTVWPALAERVAGSDLAANPLHPIPEPSMPLAITAGVLLLARLQAIRTRHQ